MSSLLNLGGLKSGRFLGVSAVDGLAMGGGLFLVSFTKKKVVDPLLSKIPWVAKQTGIAHDVVDVVSAGGSAALASGAVGIVSPRFGKDVAAAGVAYTGAKALAVPFSGLGFDETIPQFFGNLRHNATKDNKDVPPALTAQRSQDLAVNVPSASSTRSKVAI